MTASHEGGAEGDGDHATDAVEASAIDDDRADADHATDAVEDDARVRAHVHVSGTVQGVFFRATTRDRAREAGVDGWVRNLADGRVEAVFEGSRPAVESMLDVCREGPPAATVEAVDVEFERPQALDGFVVRR